jgi:hypothetical protein
LFQEITRFGDRTHAHQVSDFYLFVEFDLDLSIFYSIRAKTRKLDNELDSDPYASLVFAENTDRVTRTQSYASKNY